MATAESNRRLKAIRYTIEYTDYNNGATSPIDSIEAPENYTAEQYLADCAQWADAD